MQIKAVLFDLGWTLVNIMESPEINRRILETYRVEVTANEISKALKAIEKEYDIFEGMIQMGDDFWIRFNLKLLEEIGVQENKEFLAKKIFELWWEYADLEVYPDVIETLVQLKARGVKTGVITNGLRRDFEQILGKVKLTDFFDVVVGIDTCNKAKPDKEIFLHAVNMLDVSPEQAIFIGDSVKYDYEGAKHAGLKSLLIDREGKVSESIDAIRSLAEVLQYI